MTQRSTTGLARWTRAAVCFGLVALCAGPLRAAPLGASPLAAGPLAAGALAAAPLGAGPVGVVAALEARTPDPLRALRGSTIIAVTARADSSVVIEARTPTGRPFQFTLDATTWATVAPQLTAPTLAGGNRLGANNGRGALVLFQTALGLGYYGWAVPKILNVHDTKGEVGLYMVTAAASFAVPYLLTRHADVSDADRRMVGYGGTRGLAFGLLVNNAVGQDRSYADYDPDYLRYDDVRNADDRRKQTLAVLGSVAGSVAGYYAAGALGDDPARTEFVGVGGDYGAALAATAAYSFGWYDGSTKAQRLDRGLLATAGFASGLATGAILSGRVPVTPGDTYVLRDAIVLGAQAGLPIGYWLRDREGDSGRAIARAGAIGSLAGGALGLALIRGDDYSESDGLLLTAGQVAGGLFALGIVYLASTDIRAGTALSVSAAGSAAGFTLIRLALHRHHRGRGAR